MKEFSKYLKNREVFIKKFFLSKIGITGKYLDNFLLILKANLSIQYLVLDDNDFENSLITSFLNYLWGNSTLRHLSLNNCRLLDQGVKGIAQGLNKNFALEYLFLRNNYISVFFFNT
jgi:Ran GTPase-activating protein (RanGAP) involved in mRNA processing and transport